MNSHAFAAIAKFFKRFLIHGHVGNIPMLLVRLTWQKKIIKITINSLWEVLNFFSYLELLGKTINLLKCFPQKECSLLKKAVKLTTNIMQTNFWDTKLLFKKFMECIKPTKTRLKLSLDKQIANLRVVINLKALYSWIRGTWRINVNVLKASKTTIEMLSPKVTHIWIY